MNSDEWINCIEPHSMLVECNARRNKRKVRHYFVACCLKARKRLPSSMALELISECGLYADGVLSAKRLKEIRVKYENELDFFNKRTSNRITASLGDRYTTALLCKRLFTNDPPAYNFSTEIAWLFPEPQRKSVFKWQSNVVREIFPNPFQSVPVFRKGRDVIAIAEGIYSSSQFDTMPILADALEDAGCNNEHILTHCRNPHAVHVRGCWVVDLVLGKS